MNLNKLYKLQAELDKHILEKHNIQMSEEELLDNTILALLVEIGELANTTRCFKHWSTKGMMDKEIVLDELADVWHFYLSIGNQIGMKLNNYNLEDVDNSEVKICVIFTRLYRWITDMVDEKEFKGPIKDMTYEQVGTWIKILWETLGFADEEVEQAYLKKHEENYRRQEEGY